jgi:hypothetical protein
MDFQKVAGIPARASGSAFNAGIIPARKLAVLLSK